MEGIVVFAFLSFVLYSALAWFVIKLMLLQTKQNYKKQRKERKGTMLTTNCGRKYNRY